MRVEVVDLFPVPLGIYKWDDDKHDELKDTVRRLIKGRQIDGSPISPDIFHFWNTTGENFLDEEEPILDEFKKFLSKSYVDYTQNVYKWDVTKEHFITDCWVNVTTKGGWQYKHSHANCFVSGTYYLNFPQGSTGLSFHSPSIEKTSPYLSAMPKGPSKYNAESLTMMPEESILFLWPSNITHETKILQEDVRRVSISMNFVPSELDTGIYRLRLSR
jgi:uncharacterized protein (TIGR02466 family)|tara:strand:- start:80 stop:730 length:651 start_codon:yes stop_codon:yes gene_type:complete